MGLTTDTEIKNTIDWYSYTCDYPTYSLKSTMTGTPLDAGLMGYTAGVRFLDKRLELVNPTRPDMRVHVVYSGEALALGFVEYQTSPLEIISIVSAGEKVARIDIAVDVRNGSLNIANLAREADAGKHETRSIKSYYYKTLGDVGETLYVGAPSSKVRLRIYDKAAEQKMDGYEWTRIELQVRGKRAQTVKNTLRKAKSLSSIQALIRGFCDFPTDREYVIVMGANIQEIAVPENKQADTRQWLLNSVARTLGREIALDATETLAEEFAKSVEIERLRVDGKIRQWPRRGETVVR